MPDDAAVAGQFTDVLEVLDRLRAEGIIVQYAVAGAMAVNIWDEPVATQDVDVAVIVAGQHHPLDPLRPVLTWLTDRGYAIEGEHVLVAGVPVQFLPVWNPVVTEGVQQAAEVRYDPADPDSPVLRVMRPTYLVASWQVDPAANSPKRRERAARLREAGLVDEVLLAKLLRKVEP
jgi:hypothetical protein